MGVDVASFGDFFADMRPVEVQVQTVSRIVQRPASATSPTKGIKNVYEDKAQPSVEVVIDDTAMSGKPMVSKPPASKGRGDKMDQPIKCLVYKDPFGSTYKKYIFTADGKYLLGGQMIGDVGDYVKLVAIVKKKVLVNLLLSHPLTNCPLESARGCPIAVHCRHEERRRRRWRRSRR
jgi:nitrite reductase (NAD(P)H)